jgi:subtilisin family serine protease
MKKQLSVTFFILIFIFTSNFSITFNNTINTIDSESFVLEMDSNDIDWSYNLVNGKGANTITNGSSDVIVAILDTGVDYRIEEINNSLWVNSEEIANNSIDDDENGYTDDINGWNFVDTNSDILDIVGHGTFIASLFTGADDSTTGNEDEIVIGLAPKIKILPLKVIESENDSDTYSTGDFVDAISYAVKNNASIISMSLTWLSPPQAVVDALRWAYNQGVLLVSVSGNDAEIASGVSFLSKMPEMIAVGAVDKSSEKAIFSQFGEELELMAPGDEIFGTVQLNGAISANLYVNNISYHTVPLDLSAKMERFGELVYASLGQEDDFQNINVSGKITLIDRGGSFFRDKVANASSNGAIGVIITNNEPKSSHNPDGLFYGTLIQQSTIPVVAISQEDGILLKDKIITDSNPVFGEISISDSNTTHLSGTSFAAPHVAATAALMLSVNPDLNNSWIRLILRRTTTDLNVTGWDKFTGYGLLNASFAVESAMDKGKPEIVVLDDSTNTLIAELHDENGLYRIDFGYTEKNKDIIRSSKFFSTRTLSYNYSYDFTSEIDNFSYYIAVEDISGNRIVFTKGNIDYIIPNYEINFQSTNDTNLVSWNLFYVFLSLFAITMIWINNRKLRR